MAFRRFNLLSLLSALLVWSYFPSAWLLAAGQGQAPPESGKRPAGHWPQWRGTDRLNRSADTGLLRSWPEVGPPLLWQVNEIGIGVGGVAIAGGRVYVLGHRGEVECLTALDEVTGKPLWSAPLGQSTKELGAMRWLSQRTPLVDGERVHAVTSRGILACLDAATGKRVWTRDYANDFAGRRGSFGVCDQLLVDGDRLICVPGGKVATVLALNKKTGEAVWTCPLGDAAAYVGAVLVGGTGARKHHVVVTSQGLVGVSTEGKLLWRNERFARNTANSYTPNILGNKLFTAGNYGRGILLLELVDGGSGVEAREVYARQMATPSWRELLICVDDHAYVGTMAAVVCVELATGKTLWSQPRSTEHLPPYSGTYADGHLYLRSERGTLGLVEANPEKFVLKSWFAIPDAKPMPGSTAPVVTGGRLYLRDEERLLCYDVLAGSKPVEPRKHTVPAPPEGEKPAPPKPPREPDAIYVPTPQDVVVKMLELADPKKTETVVDLGCGDGRIVVTAARKYGCKAVGYDIDPDCIQMSRENVARHKVEGLVTVEQQDLFRADLGKVHVVAVYLPPELLGRLQPQFGRLPPGARIVSHAFAIPNITPDRAMKVLCAEDNLEHTIYLYTAPLKGK
jgi:outer membrane protein assembly factor BamB